MSEENVELVERTRRLYPAYNRRDRDGHLADADREFEWDPTEQGGVLRGRRAITELAENWFSTWAEWQWEPEEIELTSNGERMFVSLRSWGRSKGSDAIIEGRFKQHRKKTITMVIVSMIAALAGAAEFTLRRTGYLPATAYYHTTDALTVQDMFRTDEHGIFKANPAFWTNTSEFSINSDGFRSPEFSAPATGKKAVLVIGDSQTYGIGAVPLSNAFPDLIRAAGYDVHNAGVPGTGPTQYGLVADHYVAKLKPDVTLVAFFYGNDLNVKLDPAVPNHNLFHVTNAGWILGFDECDRPLTAQEAYDY